MFHTQSSLCLKDFCYTDHIALHPSRPESRRREEKAARAKSPRAAQLWFTLSTRCLPSKNRRFPTTLGFMGKEDGEWGRRKTPRNFRLQRTEILLPRRADQRARQHRVLKTTLEGCSCKTARINPPHRLAQQFCPCQLLAAPTQQARVVCGSPRQKVQNLVATGGCGDSHVTSRRMTPFRDKVSVGADHAADSGVVRCSRQSPLRHQTHAFRGVWGFRRFPL